MFDKLLGKKQKGIQVFNIPEKKYCHDQKKIIKMQKKDLIDVISDMEKYITSLTEKLDLGKKQFQRSQQRCDQVIQKSNVLNSQMSRINNQHQELQVKLTNLQSSLQMMVQQRQSILQAQVQYIQQKGWNRQKIKDLYKVFEIYHSQLSMSQKVLQQNKQVKHKLTQLQNQYHDLSQKYNEIIAKSVIKIQNTNFQTKTTHQQQNQKQQQQIDAVCNQCQKYRNILQGKQQIITSLNKQIQAQKYKLQQNSDKIQQLNSDLEHILTKIPLKDQQLLRVKQQNIQLLNILNQYKKNQIKVKENIEKYKQQNNTNKNNIKLLENELALLKQKYQPLQQANLALDMQLKKQKSAIQRKQIQIQNFNIKLLSYQQEINSLSKLSEQIKLKDSQIAYLKNEVEKQRYKFEEFKKTIQSQQEENQLKLKKMEVSFNQQRIKVDALKRNVNNLQTKDEQNRKNLDSMYESKIQQDGKIVQMQKKLKDYKHQIQYLKKQKTEMEKTFQSKIKNMEEMVINEAEDQDQIKQAGLGASKDISSLNSPSPRIDFNSLEDLDKQNIKYQKKIAELQQQVDMLKEQNMNIKVQKCHFEQLCGDLQTSLKSLTSKREQMMRQIKKMSSIKNIQNHQKPNQKQNNEENKSRDKKIAQKAYKGFDILAKLLSALYKSFLSLHLSDIHLKQVKQIQSSINQIVRKSLDMKDIFQDYI